MNGRVTDTQGAVVAGAKISVVNQESHARSESLSGLDGYYNIPFLAPAAYTISIEAAGFKRNVREGVRLSINDRVTVDATLELGDSFNDSQNQGDNPVRHELFFLEE